MRFIVNTIIKAIEDQHPSRERQLRIRLSGFEDIRIYEKVCEYVQKHYAGLKYVLKLSEEKCKYFSESVENTKTLAKFKDNGWVAQKSLTYYRNMPLEDAQLILLMGTEAVDDQGGLSDLYFIDPDSIVAGLRGEYYKVFGFSASDSSEETDEMIVSNKLCGNLFALVPLDICKLSDISDEWGAISDASHFVELFFAALPRWGLCRDDAQNHPIPELRKSRKNILQANSDFTSRKTFQKMSKGQYAKYLEAIEKYPAQEQIQYPEDWDGWSRQSIPSYKDFANILREYIAGQNLAVNRPKLQNIDFSIIDNVLNLKIKVIKPQPVKRITVHGTPLSALTHAIFHMIAEKSEDVFDGIKLNIQSVELVDAIDPQNPDDDEQQLIYAWKKVCWACGGIFEYVENRGIEIDGRDLAIFTNEETLFDPKCAQVNVKSGLVAPAAANKKLNKICFELIPCLDEKLTKKTGTKCEWVFSANDGWLHAFDGICGYYETWYNLQEISILPIFQIENYLALVNSKSEEEFLDALDGSALICNCNLLKFIQKKASSLAEQMWHAEYFALGIAFMNFCASVYANGFYGDLIAKDGSKATAFIDTYTKLGQKITETKIVDSSMEWVFNCYIHAFAIEASERAVINDEAQESCIIPPFHPSILQKRIDQAVFLFDGCREILSELGDKLSPSKVWEAIDALEEMSGIHEGLDIFPGRNEEYLGTSRSFADFCVCGNAQTDQVHLIDSMKKKDAVYDDDFNVNSYKKQDDSSRMYYDVIKSYLKAMPSARCHLSVTVVNPGDLQPIVAAIYHHIQIQKKELDKKQSVFSENQRIFVQLHILVTPENKGGRNYLTYWVNSFFDEDENVDVKVYLNEWDTTEKLYQMLSNQTDILFLQDVLMLDNLDFIKDTTPSGMRMNECRFPIVFKPIPVMKGSVKRRIELTQKQFSASTIHSQVVAYAGDYDKYGYQKSAVTKVLSIDHERRELILQLHQYSNWVVCVDGGMDGALLRSDSNSSKYAVIGFSTGKGRQGQYNLTITARASIIEAVNEKLKSRLHQAFLWNQEKIEKASKNCLREAGRLDGVSLLSAINPRDYKINEFLAYILTAAEIRKMPSTAGVQVLVHLDSYPHWFNHEKEDEDDSNSRPDFLLISAEVLDSGEMKLDAKVIECKLAVRAGAEAHRVKARGQVLHGIERLSSLFDPHSHSIRRRYWFAQLYRALSFAQITFSADDEDFAKYSETMRGILEGHFSIDWTGCILGYWKDMDSQNETVMTDSDDSRIEFRDIPQQMIQKMLLGDDSEEVSFINVGDLGDEEAGEAVNYIPEKDEEYASEDMDEFISVAQDYGKPETYEGDAAIHLANGDENPLSNNSETMVPVETECSAAGIPGEPIPATETVIDETAAQDIQPAEPIKKELKDIRVFIGNDRNKSQVFWEFGNPKMANRHLLITGTSGQGKTYCIQTMLKELSVNGIPAVIFDYTEGFRLDQLDPAFTDALTDKLDQRIIYATGVPINPFVQHEIEIAGTKMKERASDVAQRIANIFTHVYNFGDQQFSAIYEACRSGIQQYGEAMNMERFREKLNDVKNPAAKTVLSKMTPFLDSAEFLPDPDFNWGKLIHSDGTVTVIQLTNFVREIQVIITELMLWDAWYYNSKFGNKDTPFVVVLDEAQNLSHKSASPSAKILTEGRKFGWSAWFATQSLKVLDSDEIVRLQQASFKLYFKPTDEEITTIAKAIDPTAGASSWTNALKGLRKGQAVVAGDRNRPDGHFGHVNPTVTSIASFKERENETY